MRHQSLTDAVVEYLRGAIATGEWAVGDRIPPDAEIMAATGAGRNTVRESIQALVQAGMLARMPSKGTFVTATSPMAEIVTSLSRREVLEVRLAIDGTAAALAALRRSDADIARLRHLLAARSAAFDRRDAQARAVADTALHTEVVRISGNRFFAQVYASLADVMHETLLADVADDSPHDHDDHGELVEAIVDGDDERAGAAGGRILARRMPGEQA